MKGAKLPCLSNTGGTVIFTAVGRFMGGRSKYHWHVCLASTHVTAITQHEILDFSGVQHLQPPAGGDAAAAAADAAKADGTGLSATRRCQRPGAVTGSYVGQSLIRSRALLTRLWRFAGWLCSLPGNSFRDRLLRSGVC